MKIIVETGKHDFLNYVSVQGLKKTKNNERITTNVVTKLLRKEMLSHYTLNNWKGDRLMIRYATNSEELSILLDAIKSDVNLPKSDAERSLLY